MKFAYIAVALIIMVFVVINVGGKSNVGKIKIYDPKSGKVVEAERVIKTDYDWKRLLTKEQYDITVKKGTERPGTCALLSNQEKGLYRCVRCGIGLFLSGSKFKSGTGWPSYFQPVSDLNIKTEEDKSQGMQRVEVLCSRCDAHLGHVFTDGPAPTGLRYCINGVALKFEKGNFIELQRAMFGAGCFWHVEEEFLKVKGIIDSTVGYAGGTKKEPTYKEVCSNTTGHAEVVLVEFNPEVISYKKLLEKFFEIHNPTTPNRQGPDVGTQYRSAIFYFSEEQKTEAETFMKKLKAWKTFRSPIVTEVVPASVFYKAEEYHQNYMEKKNK